MRCVALAEEWATRGRDVVFVADLARVPWARDQVERRGFTHLPPPASYDDEVATVAALDPAFVVVDSYLLPAEVYAGLRELGAGTLALVDGDPAGRPADLWLDQNIGAEQDAWEVPAGTTRLAGLDHALMRDDIRRAAARGPARRGRRGRAAAGVRVLRRHRRPRRRPGGRPRAGRTGRPFAARFVGASTESARPACGPSRSPRASGWR